MTEPTAPLAALRASSADLIAALAASRWSDDDLASASLCHGWTRAHVLSHLARNADAIAGVLSGVLRGEVVPMYPGGPESRNADIEAGAQRSAAEIVADLGEAVERLDRVLGAVADAEVWHAVGDRELTAAEWVARRLAEVEIHRVDLAADYTPDRWPPVLVSTLLPQAAEGAGARSSTPITVGIDTDGSVVPSLGGRTWGDGSLEVRGPDWAVLAWLIGRTPVARDALTAAPELAPWG